MSSSTRRMWIEIGDISIGGTLGARHPPHGGCGLKSCFDPQGSYTVGSSSTRRMWIEIDIGSGSDSVTNGHPPHGGCGLKYLIRLGFLPAKKSSSTRRMWIEIIITIITTEKIMTSSSTRRMWIEICGFRQGKTPLSVILHTEDVD